MGKCPAQVFPQASPHVPGEGPGPFQLGLKLLIRLRKPEGLQLHGIALSVLAHQHKVSSVGDQHQPVAAPIAAHLVARRRQPSVVTCGLDLHHAPLRDLARPRRSLLHLLRGVEAEVRMPGSLLGEFTHAEHLGPEGTADGVQQIAEWPVAGPFTSRSA